MKVLKQNKKVYFEYEILKTYTAGIELKGSEVKSILGKNMNIEEAYCFIVNGELILKNMHISEYKRGGMYYNHDPLRSRKLLLKKREIESIHEDVKLKGCTIVPLSILISESGFIKVEVVVVKGKNNYDKSIAIKERDMKRDLEKNFSGRG
jgi:SsrA-binding protein